MFDPAYPFTLDRDIWCADHPRPSKVAGLIHGGTVLVTRDAAQGPTPGTWTQGVITRRSAA